MNYSEFKTEMRQFIQHAPPATKGPEDLLGFYFPIENGLAYICQPCASRIMGRGLIPSGGIPAWKDTPYGTCSVCGNE